MERVGGPIPSYDEFGAVCRRDFLALLPPSFGWDGARVLDFGCGAGRTLRHFGFEANRAAEFWACDVDSDSIEWVQQHLSPPFRAFCNGPAPPLPLPDCSLDLVYSMSVFTHLTEAWSAWLLELHRVLKPGGTLLATTLGPGAADILGCSWDEDRIGMLVTMPHEPFSAGGPVVFHSQWWIREHWGRAFDVLDFWPWGFGLGGPQLPRSGQGCVALRKHEATLTAEDLDRPADDPREWAAVAENLAVVHAREARWRARGTKAEADLENLTRGRSWRLARALSRLGHPLAQRSTHSRRQARPG
jgi:SAM-dependent methyltransferase